MFSKTRVAVLRGGPSSEYEISLRSGAAVLQNLPERFHEVDVFIDKRGDWHIHGRRESAHKILGMVDAVFNALHGEYGKDGTVQRLLRLHAVPHTGPRELAAAFAMHKRMTKDHATEEGIRTPYFTVLRKEDAADLQSAASHIYRTFPQPAVVKPLSRGSSLGVSVARTPDELAYALALAFELCDSVLIEEYIEGSEIVCGVIEDYRGEPAYALIPLRATLPSGSKFLDYEGRRSGQIRYEPAHHLPPETRELLMDAARRMHNRLGLRHYSTSDFLVHPKRGVFYLETDALPSLASDAPLPVALREVGGTLPHFIEHVISLALTKK